MHDAEKQQSLFMEPLFCQDTEAWNKIADIVPTNAKDKVKEDLLWFQKAVRARNATYRYDKIDPTDNEAVIDKFSKLKAGPDSRGKEKAPYLTPELRQKIKQRLLSLYVYGK